MNRFAIFGVPRSGTSWLSQICNSHPDVTMRFQPLFSYTHKGRLKENSTAKEINKFFEEIRETSDPFVLMSSAAHRNYPRFLKSSTPTHLGFKETRYLNIIENLIRRRPDVKIIGIIRNPLAVLASWVNAPKEYDKKWDFHTEWRFAHSKNSNRPEEFYGFSKWKETAENFLKYESLYPEQFKLIRYDFLNSNPEEATVDLFRFVNLKLHSQVRKFIVDSKSIHDANPYSVFRAKANDRQWREVIPQDIQHQIEEELANSPLYKFYVAD